MIVIEESDESCFWLEFVIDENLLIRDLVESLLQEATELRSFFGFQKNRPQIPLS